MTIFIPVVIPSTFEAGAIFGVCSPHRPGKVNQFKPYLVRDFGRKLVQKLEVLVNLTGVKGVVRSRLISRLTPRLKLRYRTMALFLSNLLVMLYWVNE